MKSLRLTVENNSPPGRQPLLTWVAKICLLFWLGLPAAAQTAEQWGWQGLWPIRHLTVAAQGVVLTGSDRSNYLYGLDAATGQVLWSRNLYGSVWSPPTLSGSLLYVAPNDQALWSLRVETGELVWWLGPRFPQAEGFAGAAGRPNLNRAPPALLEKGLVSVSLNGILSRLTLEGQAMAHTRLLTTAERDQFWSRPAVLGQRVWLGSTGGRLWRVSLDNLQQFEVESLGGSQVFPSRDQVLADLLPLGDRVLVATLSGSLHCFGPDGARLWTRRLGVGRVPMSQGGRLLFAPVPGPSERFFVSTRSRVYCLDKAGQTVWDRPFVQGVAAPVAYSEEQGVVLLDGLGVVNRLSPTDGQPLDTLSIPPGPSAGPALWGQTLLVGYGDGWVRAYKWRTTDGR